MRDDREDEKIVRKTGSEETGSKETGARDSDAEEKSAANSKWLLVVLAAVFIAAAAVLAVIWLVPAVTGTNVFESGESMSTEAEEGSGNTRKAVGYVKDADTGEPLANAYVRIECGGQRYGYVTDQYGRFETEDLPAGHYTLLAKAKEHDPSPEYSFDLTPGKTARFVDIFLTENPDLIEIETEEMPWEY